MKQALLKLPPRSHSDRISPLQLHTPSPFTARPVKSFAASSSAIKAAWRGAGARVMMFGYSQSENVTSRVDMSQLCQTPERAERGSGDESVVIKRGLSEHLTSLKRRACSVGTGRGFALLVIKLAASPPEQSIKNVALRSGGGQVSLSSLIFYRKSAKKTSLGLFFLSANDSQASLLKNFI